MAEKTRREFLKDSLQLAACACCAEAFGVLGPTIVYGQGQVGNGKIVVFITCDGGFDSLEMECPIDLSAYYSTRPTIAIPAGNALALGSGVGLHPSFVRLKALWDQGDVAIIRRSGVVQGTRAHDQDQNDFARGGKGSDTRGLLGRIMDINFSKNGAGSYSSYNTIAIGMGNPIDTSCNRAVSRPINVPNLASYRLNNDETNNNDNLYRQEVQKRILGLYNSATGLPKSVAQAQQGTHDSIARLQAAVTGYSGFNTAQNPQPNQNLYPNSSPGPQLRQIAMLIEEGLGTQLALCGMGGFDLHADLGNVTGNQATLLRNLDQAIGTFANDMARLGKWGDTVVVVQTEFGRTLRENGSLGTDHGWGFSEFIIGGSINGGIRGGNYSNGELTGNPNWIRVDTHYQNARKEIFNWMGLSTQGAFPENYTVKGLNLLA